MASKRHDTGASSSVVGRITVLVLAFCNERIAVELPDNPLQVPAQAVALRVQMEHEVARGAIERGHEFL